MMAAVASAGYVTRPTAASRGCVVRRPVTGATAATMDAGAFAEFFGGIGHGAKGMEQRAKPYTVYRIFRVPCTVCLEVISCLIMHTDVQAFFFILFTDP